MTIRSARAPVSTTTRSPDAACAGRSDRRVEGADVENLYHRQPGQDGIAETQAEPPYVGRPIHRRAENGLVGRKQILEPADLVDAGAAVGVRHVLRDLLQADDVRIAELGHDFGEALQAVNPVRAAAPRTFHVHGSVI